MRRLWLSSLGVLCVACGGKAPPRARVFAAASLTAAFTELAAEFARAPNGGEIELNFAGTPQLVLQLREGGRADVFASADEINMARVVERGGVVGAPAAFASNRLCIVVAKGNPKDLRSLSDLSNPDLVVLLCGPEVPAGRYARQALDKVGATVAPRSDEPSVKAVLSKVALGEADAGIVYATDAAAARAQVDELLIPDAHNVVASYAIAALDRGDAPTIGAQFVAYVNSPAARAVLAKHGFAQP